MNNDNPSTTKKPMTTVQILTFVVIPLIAVLSISVTAFAGYLKERDAEAAKVKAQADAQALRDELKTTKEQAATNHRALAEDLVRSQQHATALANSLADVIIARDSARAELQRQLLARTATVPPAMTTIVQANSKQDEQIMKLFSKHSDALKARLDASRRVESEETAAVARALGVDKKLRPRLQAALDVALNAIRRTSELKQLPLTEIKAAGLPDRTVLTVHELHSTVRTANLDLGELVRAELTTGEVLSIHVLAGYVKSPREYQEKTAFGSRPYETIPEIMALPQLHFQCQIPTAEPMTWQIRFIAETGEIRLGDNPSEEEKARDEGARVFSFVAAKLAAYRLDLASSRGKEL